MVRVVDPDTGEEYEDGQPPPPPPPPPANEPPDEGTPPTTGGTPPDGTAPPPSTAPTLSAPAQAYLDAQKDFDAIIKQWPNHPKTQAILQGAKAFFAEMGFIDSNGRYNLKAAKDYIRSKTGPNQYTETGQGGGNPGERYQRVPETIANAYKEILRKQAVGEPLSPGQERSLPGYEKRFAAHKAAWQNEIQMQIAQDQADRDAAAADAAAQAEGYANAADKAAQEAAAQAARDAENAARNAERDRVRAEREAAEAQRRANQEALDASRAETGGNQSAPQSVAPVPTVPPDVPVTPPGTGPTPTGPIQIGPTPSGAVLGPGISRLPRGEDSIPVRYEPFKTTYNPAGPAIAYAQAPAGQAGSTTRTKRLGWQPQQRARTQQSSQRSGVSGNTSTLRWKPFAG